MPELDHERLTWMFTQMLRIREFEERVKRTFEDHPGVIRGHTHLADGAEASIVGSLAALRDGDQLLTTYRCHGYPIALGTDPKAIMAEIYGRQDGLCGGYGGSMHLVDPDRGFLGTSGIVGQVRVAADHAGVVLEGPLHALLELADPEHLGVHPGQPLAGEIRHLGSFRARVSQSTAPSSAPTTGHQPCADRQPGPAECALFAKSGGAERAKIAPQGRFAAGWRAATSQEGG